MDNIDATKVLLNGFIDCLEGNLIDRGFCVVNPKNTYGEILVVSTKDIREVLDSFKYSVGKEVTI